MSDTGKQANHFQRRSFVYRKFDTLPVVWSEINGYASAYSIQDSESEFKCAQQMGLCDLSYLQRVGFKGAGTIEWLSSQGINTPDNINSAVISNAGCITARLGASDILILDNLKNTTNTPSKLEQQWHHDYSPNNKPCGYIMPRQDSHACFSVCGENAPEMFSTLCAIDLRANKFSNLMIAQTSLARLGAVIIRNDIENIINYLVLVESVSAEYCWDCLCDAIRGFSGNIIGTATLAELTS